MPSVYRRIFIALAAGLAVAAGAWASPYATEVVAASSDLTGSGLYNSPAAVLGAPATDFYDPWGTWSGGTTDRRVKLVEPAYNTDSSGNKLITTINLNSYITVKFDHAVEDDALNPFGLDFLVFGNTFYTSTGFVNDSTDMNTLGLTGGDFAEPVLVSVSQDGVSWYDYVSGPYGDTVFPTQGYHWDAASASWTDQVMDFTKPVNPSVAVTIAAGGLTAADAIALYDGSGGGTGFDLAQTGFSWIQYIRVSGVQGYSGGEIDAFADVAPEGTSMPEPGTLALLAGGLIALRRRRSR